MRRTRNTQETTVLPAKASPPLVGAESTPWGLPRVGEQEGAQAPQLAPEEIVVRVRRHGRHLSAARGAAVCCRRARRLLHRQRSPSRGRTCSPPLAGVARDLRGDRPDPRLARAAGGRDDAQGYRAPRILREAPHRGFARASPRGALEAESDSAACGARAISTSMSVPRRRGSTMLPGLNALHAALQELSERSYDEQIRVERLRRRESCPARYRSRPARTSVR